MKKTPWDFLHHPDFVEVDEFGHYKNDPAFCAYKFETLYNALKLCNNA